MTKKHFIEAAHIVDHIRCGKHWTNEAPYWADDACMRDTSDNMRYARAVWTAEAFICLCTAFSPRFDVQRFLKASGLIQ